MYTEFSNESTQNKSFRNLIQIQYNKFQKIKLF